MCVDEAGDHDRVRRVDDHGVGALGDRRSDLDDLATADQDVPGLEIPDGRVLRENAAALDQNRSHAAHS
jgi:hypothetical protein